jgi:parvulin-like peptidyl-prolyl isomerase
MPKVLLVACLMSVCLLGASRVWAEMANGIAAIVNEDVITEADIATSVSALQEDPPGEEVADTLKPEEMRASALWHLIEGRLLLQQAKQDGIVVSADEVSQRIAALRERFDSEEQFEISLAQSHVTREQLKEKMRDQLMIQRLIDTKIRATIIVSPQEVAKELASHPELAKSGDRLRVSHILVRVNEERAEAQAREKIEGLYQQLTSGADFAALAKRHSEDAHSEEGGLLGWVAQGELMPELDAALASLSPGAVSPVIKTRLGFHIVKMEERRAATSLSMLEANRAVYQQLFNQKFQEAMVRWLNELKRKAYIEIPG